MHRFTPLALVLVGALVVAAAGGAGCRNQAKTDAADKKAADAAKAPGQRTLYERLGGEDAIRRVVHDFVQRGANNGQVNFTRRGRLNEWEPTPDNVKRLEERLVQFISQQTGGPQIYRGASMAESHRGMEITSQEFDALAADLKATLEAFNVGEQEQGELMEIVGETKPEIVGK